MSIPSVEYILVMRKYLVKGFIADNYKEIVFNFDEGIVSAYLGLTYYYGVILRNSIYINYSR